MTLLISAKVLLHVGSYDFYDMTLSTGKQRRHMIKYDINPRTHRNRSEIMSFGVSPVNYSDSDSEVKHTHV